MSASEAEAAFLDCCGSQEWARAMVRERPFKMVESVFTSAGRIWRGLSLADYLEAFAAHPKIGSKKAARSQKPRAAGWSAGEQARAASAEKEVLEQLREANRLYEDKFGFIFIVCATGKTAGEMLAICKARLGNSVQSELAIAADEQFKITEIRLRKLLEQ